MVAEFPIFSKVTLEDKRFFDEFNAQFAPYADWAFGTLMTWWDAFDDLSVARLGKNIVIQSSYLSMGKERQFILLGNDAIDEAIRILFAYQAEHNLPQGLSSLPQYTVDALRDPEKYLIAEDPTATEYVLSSTMHSTLAGGEMAKARLKIHKFTHETEGHLVECATLPMEELSSKMLLINTLHTWKSTIYHNDKERLEGAIIDRALCIAEYIDMRALGLFIDKKLEGFALYKPLHTGYANINHIKVSYDYPYIFSYMMHKLAGQLLYEGVEFMNNEQDLGIEGLRTHKRGLRPVHMLAKYNLYPAL